MENREGTERYSEKRAIVWARQASTGSERSCERQIASAYDFAKRSDIRIVDEVLLHGVSGCSDQILDVVQALVARKRAADDFDLLLVKDLSRLTRRGLHTGMAIQLMLEEAGVELVNLEEVMAVEDTPEIVHLLAKMTQQQQRDVLIAILGELPVIIRRYPGGAE